MKYLSKKLDINQTQSAVSDSVLGSGFLPCLKQGKTKNTAYISSGVFGFALSSLLAGNVLANTPANTLITNTAHANYEFLGEARTENASVQFITARDANGSGTPSVITLMHNSINFSAQYQAASAAAGNNNGSNAFFRPQARTGASSNGQVINGNYAINAGRCATDGSNTNFITQPAPTDHQGNTLSLPSSFSLSTDEYFKVGDTIFVHLQDLDQNQDPTQVEKIVVTLLSDNGSDQETIELTETDISSGLFTGFVQSTDVASTPASHFDCQLSVTSDSSMQASYQDQFDSRDLVRAGALFDPTSYVVNADTGEYVNGIEVTLLDSVTGLPAQILSSEGGVYPNPVTTGGSVTDSLGNAYNFPYGGFVFPVIDNGQYRVQIGNSAYYDYPIAPTKSLAEIQALPSGPFNFDDQGSRALSFDVNGNSFRMDVPLDPKDNSVLLTKTANKTQAGLGEMVRYRINIQNSEIPGTNIHIKDLLPQGFRYEAGSAKISGIKVNDPVISTNGRELDFVLTQLAVDEEITLEYLARISVNTPIGTATNHAWLEDQEDVVNEGLLSGNNTSHAVEIREDLFASNARLFGQVYIGDCHGKSTQEGLSGVRIYMEDGSYVVSDEDGLWHMENVKPGSHVLQLDTETIPKYLDIMACENYGQHAGREYSQFVDVAKGSFWRTDFVLKLKPPSAGEVTQRLSSEITDLTEKEHELLKKNPKDLAVKQKIHYRLNLNGTEVILKNLRALLMLPEGVQYQEGSALVDGQPIKDPQKYDEQTLLFSVSDPGKHWQHTLEFNAWITKKAKAGELTTRSIAMFNSPSQNNQRTPMALTSALLAIVPENRQVHKPKEAPKFSSFSESLSQADIQAMQSVIDRLKGLDNLKIEVAGHTDSMPIARRSRHIFKNNYELSLARARGAANYLIAELGLEPHQVSITGYGAKKPISRNKGEQSRALNRRVEVNILSATNGMSMAQADSGNQMIATMGIAPGGFDFPVEATAAGDEVTDVKMPNFDAAFLAQTDNEFYWLWPETGYLPNIPSTKVAIKHPHDHKVELKLNGEPVSELNFSNKEVYSPNKSAVSLWTGVDVKEGNNVFEASLLNSANNIVNRITYRLHYAGTPTRIELVKDKTKALADGVVNPVIAIKLFDKDGYPVRNGLQGEFSVDQPYVALDPNKNQNQINRQDFKPQYEVEHDGTAYLTLEPTTQAGEATIRFPLANGKTEEIRVWLTPQNRDWMLIALGEGTIGYNAISGHVKNANSNDVKDDVYTDGRLALFAKGQILGDWLLTAAYDSEKGKTTPFEKLIDPNQYYTLYGDSSEQKLDASMEGKLYLRIEKERFYTVFGDYSTDLNHTELSKYLRKFHGIQSVFQGDIVSFNAFVTESSQRFVRDEIRGDGTSGLYKLSEDRIIPNSETISIQVRDRFRSEIILSEVELSKNVDYSIDYIDGTIFFKSPVQSTDGTLNPKFIIARYESAAGQGNDLTYGGRTAIHNKDKTLEVGLTSLTEELGEDKKELAGLDVRFKLSKDVELRAESAITQNTVSGATNNAQANWLSLNYQGEQFQTQAHIRTEEAGFGLEQLNASEGNTEKVSIDSSYYLTSQQYVSALLSDQNTLGSTQRHSMAELKFNQEYEFGRYHLGARVVDQTSIADDTVNTQQLLAGHSLSVFGGKLLVNGDLELNLDSNEDTYDLLRLGADYRIRDDVTLFAVHENGFESDAPMRSQLGLRTTPWSGMQISNSVEEQSSKDGVRLFAVHGLNQELNLDEHWQVSFGFDQSQDLENSVIENTANTSQQEDFYAVSTGWGYRSSTWQWTNRLEYREASANKWNAISSLYRPVGLGFALGMSGEYRKEQSDTSETVFKQVEFDIGLRPLTFGLAWLNQSKLITEEQNDENGSLLSQRLINNTHLNMRWTKMQLSAQYGFKYVDETIDSELFSGFIDLSGLQFRHHITPKWDWGLHGQRLHDYELSDSRYSLGVSLGYIPRRNTWVSVGYNVEGFDDTDFDEAGYSAHGIYLKLRIKADQDSLRGLKAYFQ